MTELGCATMIVGFLTLLASWVFLYLAWKNDRKPK